MRQALVILWLISLSSCAVLDDGHHVEDLVFDPQLSDVLQKTLEEAAKLQEADSMSVSLYISDRCHWEGTTGETKPEPSVPIEPEMLFSFASITKTFIAAIVLQLAEENKLGLEDKLGKWLEKYPNIDANITIRQLLNHGSGLYNYRDEIFLSDMEADLDRVWLPEELLNYVGPPPKLGFDVPRYSNTNYILLGMIIEAATGSSLEQELQNRVIGPLHLDSTYLASKDLNPEHWSNSTALSNSLYSGVWAAGAIVSTPKDIAKWSHTLYSGNFLHATSLESMLVTEARRGRNGQGGMWMGLGVIKLRVGEQSAWGHSGRLSHFGSETLYLPKLELSVAYSSSVTDLSQPDFLYLRLVRAYINNRPDNISMCFDS
jgi:D-alanyl-D-alanine carboxypeptidase